MRRKPRQRVMARKQSRTLQAVKPTKQTVARLRRDQIQHLHEKGRLQTPHLEAAEEIRRLWQAFSRSLGPAAVNYSNLALSSRRKTPYIPANWLNEREEIAWRNRYRPWARETAVIKCGGVLPANRLQIVLEIVVENSGLRQVEGEYRMRHGAAFEHLRAGLHRYAELSGWIDRWES